jgi:hypothetical protein
MDKLDFLMLVAELEGRIEGLLHVAIKLFNDDQITHYLYNAKSEAQQARQEASRHIEVKK